MKRHISIAALALAAGTSLGALSTTVTPAAAAPPVCAPGFITVTSSNWLLRCMRVVPVAQMHAAMTLANRAVCTTERYWNFGPQVSTAPHVMPGYVQVSYICGHVEG